MNMIYIFLLILVFSVAIARPSHDNANKNTPLLASHDLFVLSSLFLSRISNYTFSFTLFLMRLIEVAI